jgi:hypothetical protein
MSKDRDQLDRWIDSITVPASVGASGMLHPASHGLSTPPALTSIAAALTNSSEILSDGRCLKLEIPRASTYGQAVRELQRRAGQSAMYKPAA